MKLSRLDVISRMPAEFGGRCVILPWWREGIDALDNPAIRELLIWLVRQAGKSQFIAALAASELLTVQNAYITLLAASEKQQAAIFERKLKRPLQQLTRELGFGSNDIRFTKHGIEVPKLGSVLEVVASNEETTPGRSPTLWCVDEARDVDDGVFEAGIPSVLGANGKIVIGSTAGRPSGFFYELVTHPTEATWIYHTTANENPHADAGLLHWMRTRLSRFAPNAARRELDSEFVDDADSFLPGALIEAAVDDTLGELPASPLPAFAFVDLSRRHDLTSCIVVVRTEAKRPEAADHLLVASLMVWDPKASPTKETPFDEVRAHLAGLPGRFPRLEKILVDEGSEAGSVLPFARSHAALSGRVDGFTGSVEANIGLWGALSARLHAQTLSIPRHERLIAELRNLKQESFSFGSKWRVVDTSKKFHRDVSLALAGACFAAGETEVVPPLDKSVMRLNEQAPPATAAGLATFYGASSNHTLSRRAYGNDFGGAGGLRQRAYGTGAKRFDPRD